MCIYIKYTSNLFHRPSSTIITWQSVHEGAGYAVEANWRLPPSMTNYIHLKDCAESTRCSRSPLSVLLHFHILLMTLIFAKCITLRRCTAARG